jgi:hypothetical protein
MIAKKRGKIVHIASLMSELARGLNPAPVAPMFPHAPRVIPDGRLSRVRLATMTIIAAFPIPRRLKRSPAFTPAAPVCCQARYARALQTCSGTVS